MIESLAVALTAIVLTLVMLPLTLLVTAAVLWCLTKTLLLFTGWHDDPYEDRKPDLDHT